VQPEVVFVSHPHTHLASHPSLPPHTHTNTRFSASRQRNFNTCLPRMLLWFDLAYHLRLHSTRSQPGRWNRPIPRRSTSLLPLPFSISVTGFCCYVLSHQTLVCIPSLSLSLPRQTTNK